VDADR